jgi:hypothetical protein
MKNITDLRNELCNTFDDLKAENITPKVASEMNNSAGKIINTLKVQLEYHTMTKSIPRIPFLK